MFLFFCYCFWKIVGHLRFERCLRWKFVATTTVFYVKLERFQIYQIYSSFSRLFNKNFFKIFRIQIMHISSVFQSAFIHLICFNYPHSKSIMIICLHFQSAMTIMQQSHMNFLVGFFDGGGEIMTRWGVKRWNIVVRQKYHH